MASSLSFPIIILPQFHLISTHPSGTFPLSTMWSLIMPSPPWFHAYWEWTICHCVPLTENAILILLTLNLNLSLLMISCYHSLTFNNVFSNGNGLWCNALQSLAKWMVQLFSRYQREFLIMVNLLCLQVFSQFLSVWILSWYHMNESTLPLYLLQWGCSSIFAYSWKSYFAHSIFHFIFAVTSTITFLIPFLSLWWWLGEWTGPSSSMHQYQTYDWFHLPSPSTPVHSINCIFLGPIPSYRSYCQPWPQPLVC